MLQIRLSNKATASESGVGAKLPSGETVTVACPDHLVLAELPVAKSLGSANGVTLVKTVGRRSRRPLGERVHFCVQCDFPIAIYGRLIPCEHAYCLDCARSDSICYLCDERIQKIQTIKMMEGIFICAAPHCLKSFLKKTDFESHVHAFHADLVNNSNTTQKDGNESEAKKQTTSDSTVQAPTPRPVMQQPKPTPQQMDNRPPSHGFDVGMHLQQQNFETQQQGGGIISQSPYLMNPLQPPNFVVNPNVMGPTSFGGQPLYVSPQSSEAAAGGEQGSFQGYPQPWNVDPSMMMNNQGGIIDHGRGGFFQQGGNAKDSRGILAATPPPPPPLPPPFTQMPGNFFGGDHGQGYGWQQDKRDGFGNSQD